MATVTAEAIGKSRGPFRSRNIALLGIFGVLSGTWMMFRFIAPQRGTVLATNEEMASIQDRVSKRTN